MLIIKNGTLVNPAGKSGKLDIVIEDGKISKLCTPGGSKIPDGADVINAKGLMISPGFVDVHSHFRDPGQTHKEDIYTGARAAAAGGYTSVVMMANTIPAIDNEETLSYVLKKGEDTDI